MIIVNLLPFIIIFGYLIYESVSCKYSDDLMDKYIELRRLKEGKVLKNEYIIPRTTSWQRRHGP